MRPLHALPLALLLAGLIVALAPAPVGSPPTAVLDLSATCGAPAMPRAPMAVCFAEGTDPDYMAEWTQRLLDRVSSLDYNLGGRWTNTAHGATGSQGDGVTITYSFVPDGVNVEGQQSELYARMNELFADEDTWQGLFAQVFARWGEVTGNTYVLSTDDGAAWGPNSPGVIGARGDVRIAMTPIDGGSGVLAYNYFPNRGDMVIDADENWNSGANNYRFLRNVLAHEHGHGLGLEHVCPINTTKLLEPTYTPAFDGPQHDDILAGQRGYGDPYEPNDEIASPYNIGFVDGVRVVELASLDDNTDIDWWQFSVTAGRSLTLRIEPDGRTYLEGEQNGDGSCEAGTNYNTADNQNLNITLYNGVTNIELTPVPDNGVGNPDELFRYDVPANVTNLKIQVNGAVNNEIQLYRLSIESVDPATPYTLGCPLAIDTTLLGVPAMGALVLVNPPQADELTVSSITVDGPFSVNPTGPLTLAPSGELTVQVTFDGQELGLHTGTLTIQHNGPGAALVCEVKAVAITSELVFFTGTSVAFGDVPINTTDSTLVGLRSDGNVALIIQSITTAAPFSVDFHGPYTLRPGPLLRLYPRVHPTQLGEVNGMLVISHSAPSSPDTVFLTATGTPNLATPDNGALPQSFALHQNYPNPFNPATTIAFDLPQAAHVKLRVYNTQGQLVRELLHGESVAPGRHAVTLDATGIATGVYIYRIEADGFQADRKMLLLK
ncbi:MAG: choice-of-anchor D domain-containing protein [bacterium]|nr:choice-of-anchor D domain-containing protein [bacterium]